MLSIFFIGVALSMDAFSLALNIGTLNIGKNKELIFPLFVGIMHFIMSLFGIILGTAILNIININSKILITIILIYLAYVMYIDRNKEKKIKIISYPVLILLATSVSIDSFSASLGLNVITKNLIIPGIVFLICSSSITYAGLLIGKYSVKIMKNKASIFGVIILLILAYVNICQLLFN